MKNFLLIIFLLVHNIVSSLMVEWGAETVAAHAFPVIQIPCAYSSFYCVVNAQTNQSDYIRSCAVNDLTSIKIGNTGANNDVGIYYITIGV